MSDMYGAVRSNKFKVLDVEAFKEWFEADVKFGDGIEVWQYPDNAVAFGGYTMYPSAWPLIPGGEDDDADPEWSLAAFAAAVRLHLAPGEEFRVLACGHEKLRYTAASHLKVTHDSETYTSLYEGN